MGVKRQCGEAGAGAEIKKFGVERQEGIWYFQNQMPTHLCSHHNGC